MEFDLSGEERFGRLSSWFYSLVAGKTDGISMYHFILDDLAGNKARKLLDVGTGPGNVPLMLVTRLKTAEIYAVDPSAAMLKIARKKPSRREIHFAEGYSQYLPFRMKFDLIITSVSFHHWAHKKESLIYLKKFLAPGGEIRIYEFKKIKHLFFQERHSMTREELRAAVEGTGLKIKEIKERRGKLRMTCVKA